MPTRKVIVITGASDGIGAAAARALSARGHRIVLVGRSREKTQRIAQELEQEFHVADFAELEQVRALAHLLLERHPRIDVLANNAGGVFGRNRQLTIDGHEVTFQVNYLAPFLLTSLLMERLIESRASVINTSSVANRAYGRIDLANLNGQKRYSPVTAYGNAKLAQILFTRELHHRYADRGRDNFKYEEFIVVFQQVLEEQGLLSDVYSFAGFSEYPPRDYCVQYGESDLHFIQRLCFEEGFHYYFRHSPDRHELVFGDKQQAFTPLKAPTPYVPGSGLVAQGPVVHDFQMSLQACTNRTFTRDYDFDKAGRTLEADSHSPSSMRPLERYTYPGRFTRDQEGLRHSLRTLERHQAQHCVVSGQSDQPALLSGHFLTLSEHPTPANNEQWLQTRVWHEGHQPHIGAISPRQ